ncbi:MAG: hypothetical protein NTY64_11860, partial [Deltaproteobacteria bacterium]|nr:hypothetical protein [Deltaproteobacteria bacterium]
SLWGIVTLLLVIGVIIYVRMPISEAYIIRKTSAKNRSAILGVYYFGGMEGGGLLMPVVGYGIDHLGFYLTYTIAGALALTVTLICAPILWGSRD